MKLIPLTRGLFAQVDDEDYDFLMQWKWRAQQNINVCYATRKDSGMGYDRNNVPMIWMHRVLLGLEKGNPLMGDHIDHNGLNNQKNNLRIATRSQNTINRKRVKTGSSKYKWVSWCKSKQIWTTEIKAVHMRIYLGQFYSELEAAKAYDEACIKYHGEFAYLNFPQQKSPTFL